MAVSPDMQLKDIFKILRQKQIFPKAPLLTKGAFSRETKLSTINFN